MKYKEGDTLIYKGLPDQVKFEGYYTLGKKYRILDVIELVKLSSEGDEYPISNAMIWCDTGGTIKFEISEIEYYFDTPQQKRKRIIDNLD